MLCMFFCFVVLTPDSTDPSEARVAVPDERFDWLCDTYSPKKRTPAHVSCLYSTKTTYLSDIKNS